jgi:type IV secretory pathway VirD2 relaxase
MSRDDDDRFRVRPGAPKHRSQRFVSQVLREVSKAGGKSLRKTATRPGARLGRGHVAARFTGRTLPPHARRVTIKTRLVNLRQSGPRSAATHLRYIERDGVGREGEPGQAYGPATDQVDLGPFEARGRDDRHQFRFIVSPEDAEQLDDLRRYTRTLMQRMETDLGTRLDWVAVDHWNTDNPHTHIVLRGRDDTGKDIVISRDYIAYGMRERAAGLATEWLGPRTEREIQQGLQHEVTQERWTNLDRTLHREVQGGTIRLERLSRDSRRTLLIGRLQQLQRMGLANPQSAGEWMLRPDIEPVLRVLGERGDIVRTMQRAMRGVPRELAMSGPGSDASPVIGRVVGKGLVGEWHDRGYLVVDGIDGKAHYIALPAKMGLAQYPLDGVVEARASTGYRMVDRNVVALATDGIYRADHHLAIASAHAKPGHEPGGVVEAHVRRLEALRRAGIVERIAEGAWRVPPNLPDRGREYDTRQLGGVSVTLHSHLSIARQVRAVGATWLDQRLIGGNQGISELGFGSEVKDALRQRADFLVEQGLAERGGTHLILKRNLLTTLRDRELRSAAERLSIETGLTYRPTVSGDRVSGVYRRSVMLASGRFAMLDDGMGFSLVPWRPVVESRLGQHVAVVVLGTRVSWDLGRQRGASIHPISSM